MKLFSNRRPAHENRSPKRLGLSCSRFLAGASLVASAVDSSEESLMRSLTWKDSNGESYFSLSRLRKAGWPEVLVAEKNGVLAVSEFEFQKFDFWLLAKTIN